MTHEFLVVSKEHGFQSVALVAISSEPSRATEQTKTVRDLLMKSAESVGLKVAVVSLPKE